MDLTYTGIVLVPFIIGLVELAKRSLGVEAKHAPLVAVGAGVFLSAAMAVSTGEFTPKAAVDAVLLGLALGLSAAGLYSGAKQAKPAES